MAYIIIHSNREILEEYLVTLINKHLEEGLKSLEQISCDPDFCIIEKEDKGNIKIEQVKRLQNKLLFTPFNKTHQFGIIKEAHLMTAQAQNALLKTLEECHEKTVLILTVNSESSVLETILSRCTRIYPEQESSISEIKNFSHIETFLTKPLYEQIVVIEEIVKEKRGEDFLDELIGFFRQKYVNKTIKCENNLREGEILKALTQAKYRISKNVNPRIALEYICFKINRNEDTNKTQESSLPKAKSL